MHWNSAKFPCPDEGWNCYQRWNFVHNAVEDQLHTNNIELLQANKTADQWDTLVQFCNSYPQTASFHWWISLIIYWWNFMENSVAEIQFHSLPLQVFPPWLEMTCFALSMPTDLIAEIKSILRDWEVVLWMYIYDRCLLLVKIIFIEY